MQGKSSRPTKRRLSGGSAGQARARAAALAQPRADMFTARVEKLAMRFSAAGSAPAALLGQGKGVQHLGQRDRSPGPTLSPAGQGLLIRERAIALGGRFQTPLSRRSTPSGRQRSITCTWPGRKWICFGQKAQYAQRFQGVLPVQPCEGPG